MVRSVVIESYRRALPTVLLSAIGGLIAGSILGGMDRQLAAVQGLLVMVPVFLAIRGSVYGSLGSRLSSALHQGLLDPVLTLQPPLRRAIAAALLNGIVASVAAAVLTYWSLTALSIPVAPLWRLVVIAFIGGGLAGVVLTIVVVTVAVVGFRRGVNPDDIVGPTVTTAGDIFGMGALLVATEVALAIG